MSDRSDDLWGLSALFINTTVTRSLGVSHTPLLIDVSANILAKQGVSVDQFRWVDHQIATGVYPDMRSRGWDVDAWPTLVPRLLAADILVIGGTTWLGDNSSETKKIIERLYAYLSELNDRGQWLFYGRVGGCLITGDEDGIKYCTSNMLYSLQHIGYSIPPQADAGWIGESGPGPSYGDLLEDGSCAGLSNDFTNRNTTFMTWNLLPGPDAQGGGWLSSGRKPAEGMEGGRPLRFRKPRIPILTEA